MREDGISYMQPQEDTTIPAGAMLRTRFGDGYGATRVERLYTMRRIDLRLVPIWDPETFENASQSGLFCADA